MTKEKILAALPKLTRPDLEAVAAMAGHLLGGRVGNTPPPVSPIADLIFSALVTTLGQPMALGSYSPTATRAFLKKLPALEAFMGESLGLWKEAKVVQIAVLRMVFDLLREDLKSRGVNPTIGIMVVNMGRIPEVFDDAFPNYLQAGMGPVILKRFKL